MLQSSISKNPKFISIDLSMSGLLVSAFFASFSRTIGVEISKSNNLSRFDVRGKLMAS